MKSNPPSDPTTKILLDEADDAMADESDNPLLPPKRKPTRKKILTRKRKITRVA